MGEEAWPENAKAVAAALFQLSVVNLSQRATASGGERAFLAGARDRRCRRARDVGCIGHTARQRRRRQRDREQPKRVAKTRRDGRHVHTPTEDSAARANHGPMATTTR